MPSCMRWQTHTQHARARVFACVCVLCMLARICVDLHDIQGDDIQGA